MGHHHKHRKSRHSRDHHHSGCRSHRCHPHCHQAQAHEPELPPPPQADCGSRKCRKKGRCKCSNKKCPTGPTGPAGPSGVLQTKYALVQSKTLPQNMVVSLLSVPIMVNSGILEILSTFSFVATDAAGADVSFRLSIDGAPPVLVSSQAAAQTRNGSGAMVYSTKTAPLSPGLHTIDLTASVNPLGNAQIVAGQGHAAMYIQETSN